MKKSLVAILICTMALTGCSSASGSSASVRDEPIEYNINLLRQDADTKYYAEITARDNAELHEAIEDSMEELAKYSETLGQVGLTDNKLTVYTVDEQNNVYYHNIKFVHLADMVNELQLNCSNEAFINFIVENYTAKAGDNVYSTARVDDTTILSQAFDNKYIESEGEAEPEVASQVENIEENDEEEYMESGGILNEPNIATGVNEEYSEEPEEDYEIADDSDDYSLPIDIDISDLEVYQKICKATGSTVTWTLSVGTASDNILFYGSPQWILMRGLETDYGNVIDLSGIELDEPAETLLDIPTVEGVESAETVEESVEGATETEIDSLAESEVDGNNE